MTDIVSRMNSENQEFIIDNWNKELQKAIKIGKKEVRDVVDSPINKDKWPKIVYLVN